MDALQQWCWKCRVVVVGLIVSSGCGNAPTAVDAKDNGSAVRLAVGEELTITLGNVGPGQYQVPPSISTPAVVFVTERHVPPFNPGGVRQVFQFRAVNRGVAHIALSQTDATGAVHNGAYSLVVTVR